MALDHNVKANAILGFKVGTQAAVDTILRNGSGAVHGSFYLTNDSHRLYVGNEDTSLSPVNEGVTTVTALGNLPSVSNADRDVYAGRFYYVANDNILCVYNGSAWVQINTNTNTSNESFETVAVDITDGVRVSEVLTDTAGNSLAAYFHILGDDGVTITRGSTSITVGTETVTVPTITISADYSLDTATNATSGVDIQLKSGDSSNDSSINIKGAANTQGDNNVTITKTTGGLSIATKDTKVESVDITNHNGGGFDIGMTNNDGSSVTPTTFNPQIAYGKVTPVTVQFQNGTATLDIYTASEIDETLRVLNAMTYRGTIGTTGTAATAISGSSANNNLQVKNGNTNVDVSIGDTFLVSNALTVDGHSCTVGSILIARSSDGTENAQGHIESSKLRFDVVQSTNDTDTTYQFVQNQNNTGIILESSTGNAVGELKFAGDTWISAVQVMANGSSEITISHNTVTRTDTAQTAQTGNKANSTTSYTGTTTFTAVTGVTSDTAGHVTGVSTKQITVYDTNAYIDSDTQESSAYSKTTSGVTKNIGVIKHTIGMTTGAGGSAPDSVSYHTFSSQSLKIDNDDTNAESSTSSVARQGLNIEMIWGSF